MEIDQTLDLKRENKLDTAAIVVSTVMFALIIVLVSLQVVLRVINAPITAVWTEPVARFMFIVGTYFGAAVASRNYEHVRLTLVRNRLLRGRKKAQIILDIFTVVAMLTFICVALYSLFFATLEGWETRALGGTAALTAGHIYLGIFLGFVLMGVYEVQNLIDAVKDLVSDGDGDDMIEHKTGSTVTEADQ